VAIVFPAQLQFDKTSFLALANVLKGLLNLRAVRVRARERVLDIEGRRRDADFFYRQWEMNF
jgi:hypothetical protein